MNFPYKKICGLLTSTTIDFWLVRSTSQSVSFLPPDSPFSRFGSSSATASASLRSTRVSVFRSRFIVVCALSLHGTRYQIVLLYSITLLFLLRASQKARLCCAFAINRPPFLSSLGFLGTWIRLRPNLRLLPLPSFRRSLAKYPGSIALRYTQCIRRSFLCPSPSADASPCSTCFPTSDASGSQIFQN